MYSFRTIAAAAVLLASIVVNAAVPAHHVRPGAVFVAKPAHFEPPEPGHSGPSGHRNHPVIALDHPNHEGWVPVAVVSHNHPEHMQQHVANAQHYDHHTHAEGGEVSTTGSQVALGHPTHVHIDDLHHVSHDSGLPRRLHPTDTHNLQHDVHHASGFTSNNERYRTPTPPWRHHE
ncbi:hypothetical protein CPB84DRAFT_1748521 [Gymnopilus junonius]|uniref:Secreted protein n=1 Tax=Gymnopilus junonius TaxID=109634 RepID=A0A9P5TLK8_GYMJU|nr:hypothetical protein CPB84DRAFT_1748521 [Gymnopilus junonius]